MQEAIATYVSDNSSVAIEGFTGFICFAAGHEIIRQRRRDLTLVRMTPDLVYDQMVAAGVARKLVFSYLGNPGVGPLHCIRHNTPPGRLSRAAARPSAGIRQDGLRRQRESPNISTGRLSNGRRSHPRFRHAIPDQLRRPALGPDQQTTSPRRV